MSRVVALILVGIMALVGWVTYTFYEAYQPKPTILQGEIDAQSYHVSSKLPGRISKVYVKKGDEVAVGDAIFSIASPEVEAKLKQANAAKDAASAQKLQAKNGARKQEIQAAKQQYKKATAAQQLMEKTYKRIESLYKQGVVSQQKRDEVFTKYEAAKYTANAAQQIYLMAQEGARSEVKAAASAQERVYEGKVDEVNAFVKESKQYAFHSGEVSQILIHEGELSPTGFPVVSIIDMHDSWAKFSVREDYLHHFKKGAVLHVNIPALGKSTYEFKVTYIAVEGDYATWKATESGRGFDMKSFEVELTPTQPIEALRVGMSVLVEL
jgi:HlyD family secretion protein